MNWLKTILGTNPIKEVADIVDRFVDTKQDKRDFFKEVYELHAKERADARALYKGGDNGMQKVYAGTFLLSYLALTGWLVYSIVEGNIENINQFETGLIGSIWGGMTAKVNTIIDFFFGASQETNK